VAVEEVVEASVDVEAVEAVVAVVAALVEEEECVMRVHPIQS